MKCPVCKIELVVWKKLHLETLDEHVCNPNGPVSLKDAFRCPSKICETNFKTYEPKVFWNEGGELYSSPAPCSVSDISFIDNNDAPFGSLCRQMNVEIHKKDENKLLFKFPCWPLKGWKLRSRYSYKSNLDGDILIRRFHLEWIRNDGVYHIWGYRMLIFSLRHTWNDYKFGRCDNLKNSINRGAWPRAEWWRKINAKVAKLILKCWKNGN
jgi:hypothetical protein